MACMVLPVVASAQCEDSTTRFMYYASNLIQRTGGNNVTQITGGYVTGDYWFYWAPSVTATSYRDTVQLHQGSASAAQGQTVQLIWNDAPSVAGAGLYHVIETNTYTSPCGQHTYGPFTDGRQVDKPTITLPNDGILFPTALWNLGPGTDNYIPTSDGYAYRQAITITVNNHCLPGDTCDDTPTWTINSPASTLVLSAQTGTSVSLLKGSAMGNCKTDTPVSVNLGGFSSDSTTFGVNSPGYVVSRADLNLTENLNPGYRSNISWQVTDVCPGGADRLTTIPMYEAFQGWSFPGVISGWRPGDTADSASGFNYSFDPTVFRDFIWATDPVGTWNPLPVWTSSGPPYTYSTLIMSAAHQYYVGTQTFTGGTQVFSGSIYHYKDHGDTY